VLEDTQAMHIPVSVKKGNRKRGAKSREGRKEERHRRWTFSRPLSQEDF